MASASQTLDWLLATIVNEIAAMFDSKTISGLARAVKHTDGNRFQQVAFLKENGTTFKPTTSFYRSPFTGAQFSMTPEQVRHRNDIYWRLHFWLPTNAILRGQNYVLGDHWDMPAILRTTAKFLRWFLLSFGFTPAEAQYFIETARFEDIELSYNVACSTQRGATNAQRRLVRHLECLNQLRAGNYGLWKVKVMRTNKAMTTYGHVQDAMLRTYLKGFLARPTERKARMVGFVSERMLPYVQQLRAAVASHIRIEPVLDRPMLIKHGIDVPHGFDPSRIPAAIDDVFAQAGLLTPFVRSIEQVDQSTLFSGVRDTLSQYFRGEDLKEILTPSTRSRHGAILRPLGVEIGVSPRDHRFELSGTIGKQLGCENRWDAPGELRPLMLTEKYLASIDGHLDKEIAHLTNSFSQVAHDMREMERRQGVFLSRCRDPYLSDWLSPIAGVPPYPR